MERPKEPPRVLILGAAHNPQLALLAALSRATFRAPMVSPPPAPQQKEAPVMARVGKFFRRRIRSPYFVPSVAPNAGELLAKLNAFYAARPRPWRPRSNAARIRRRAYTAPKVRVCT